MNRNDILRTTMLNLGMKVEEDKTAMYLYNDKMFLNQDELYDYIEKEILNDPDCIITKENIEQKILDKISEEAEEIKIEVEE